MIAKGLAILLLSALAVPLAAQESRWKELIEQARTLRGEGKIAEGIPVAQEAVRVAESTFGTDNENLADSLNLLGVLYDDQGKYVEAEALYKRSLAIREKALGPDHPDVANSLNNLAGLYDEQGKYAEAEPLLKRSLAIREKALGPDHPDVANSLNNLAGLYQHQGKYAEAGQLFKRSLAIREKALGPDHPDVANSLNNLGGLYDEQGKYAEAEPLYKRSLAIREKALGPDHPLVASNLNNLGLLYQEWGKYAEAEPLYKRSLAILEKALGPGYPDVAKSLGNLAGLYREQGKYAEAVPLYERSLAILEKDFGPDHPDVASGLNHLAEIEDQQGKYAEAVPLYERSLAIREKALGPDHPDVAATLSDLATLYRDQGELAQAEQLHKRSLAIREKAFGPDNLEVAASLNSLAVLQARQGKYAEAEPLFKRSLAIREKALGSDHPDVANILNNLASLYNNQGQYAVAAAFFERGIQNLSRQFESSFAYMSEKDRLQFLNKVQSNFDIYLSFCLAHSQEDSAIAGKMYDVLLWEKGMVGASVSALRAQVGAGGDAEALKIFDQLAAKKSESARLANTRPRGWEELRESVEGDANDLEQQLARRASSLTEQKRTVHFSWRDVQKALQPGEATVEVVSFPFFDGKDWTGASNYIALIVTPQSRSEPTLVPLGDSKDLEADPLRDYRLRVGLQAHGSARGVTVTTHGGGNGPSPKRSFYDAFWKPLEPALKGIDRIYLSPDGVLNQVALGDVAAEDGRLLMEKYDLRIVLSTKDILRGPRKATSNSAVLVGNPTFDLDVARQRLALLSLHAALADHSAPVAEEVASLRSRELKSGALNPLPGTQAEVESISSLLAEQHWQVQSYTQQHALKESVMEVKGPRVLHLATHGFFEPDQHAKNERPESNQPSGLEDPMLRSGLFFAGANRLLSGHAAPADLDDGVLTAYEATQLNLQGTELVVLSACETGLGEVTAGEGVFGLRRALQVAGAESVLMSMWAVPDKETQELMTLFYKKWLSGKNKHKALREAQLEMRERIRARYGKDLPQYWGAFVLVG